MVYLEAVGHDHTGGLGIDGEVNVENPAAFIAVKVAVLLHVGTITRGGAVEIHVADEAALDQGVEAIVNRGHRDVRHALFGAQEDVLHPGMIALVEEHVVHVLPLRRETEAAIGEPLIQAVARFTMSVRTQDSYMITEGGGVSIFGIILNRA